MTSKRKRVVLTIEEKYIIIKDGESATKLARIHGGWFDGLRVSLLKETSILFISFLNKK